MALHTATNKTADCEGICFVLVRNKAIREDGCRTRFIRVLENDGIVFKEALGTVSIPLCARNDGNMKSIRKQAWI